MPRRCSIDCPHLRPRKRLASRTRAGQSQAGRGCRHSLTEAHHTNVRIPRASRVHSSPRLDKISTQKARLLRNAAAKCMFYHDGEERQECDGGGVIFGPITMDSFDIHHPPFMSSCRANVLNLRYLEVDLAQI